MPTSRSRHTAPGGGQIVAARAADIEALERAARPVYGTMEGDPQTASFIERIRELKASSTPADLPTCATGHDHRPRGSLGMQIAYPRNIIYPWVSACMPKEPGWQSS